MTSRSRFSNRLKIALAGVTVVGVWSYARYDAGAITAVPTSWLAAVNLPWSKATDEPCDFSTPCALVAKPGADALQINVRSGPGTKFEIVRRVERGRGVVGIARRANAVGETWVELIGGEGFAKETLLAPAEGS